MNVIPSILVLGVLSCGVATTSDPILAQIDTEPTSMFPEIDVPIEPSVDYDAVLLGLKSKKAKLKQSGDNELAAQTITSYLVDSIFPAWYGLPWDFNGHTNRPDTGVVACGYFVSTTLKHAGFNLNRYKFAQQAASIGTVSLDPSSHEVLRHGSVDRLKTWFENKPAGLWTVGLSYHVGFLYWDGGELWFIHSNYSTPFGVVRELASESGALANTEVFWLGNITHNPSLISKWLSGSFIEIRK
jgi:hypothetical protein